MIDEIDGFNEFLVRVEATAKADDGTNELPNVPGWTKGPSVVDSELNVRYATYTILSSQPVGHIGPDIDVLSELASEVENHLLETIEDDVSFEVQVHLISQPIAVFEL